MIERPNPGGIAASSRPARPIPFEDAELVEQVKSGQVEAYGELVRKYQDRVFNTCWRICGHFEDARDLTQEAFLKAFQGLQSFRHESGFYTWVFRVAVNLALSHKRTAGRRRTISLDHDPQSTGTQAEALRRPTGRTHEDDPVGRISDVELQGELVRALNGLDEEYRAVVVLRDIEGFDYQEIGVILEIPTGTVKSRLHRARASLRDAVAPLLDAERQAG